eukprot:767922-Hanusia_phi.AAC.9
MRFLKVSENLLQNSNDERQVLCELGICPSVGRTTLPGTTGYPPRLRLLGSKGGVISDVDSRELSDSLLTKASVRLKYGKPACYGVSVRCQ